MTEADELHEGTEEQEIDAATVQTLARSYYSADLGEARESAWRGFTDTEREALEEIGVAGPLDGHADDAPTKTLSKQELRMMDPSARMEAQAEFQATTKRAESEFQAGLSSLMRRELDASQQTLDEIAEIRDKVAVAADENERSALLQKGAAIVASLRGTEGSEFNPAQIQKRRQYVDGLTRRAMLTEVDANGNERTVVLSADDNPEQYRNPAPDPLPDKVSVEDFVKWDYRKRMRFAKERPEDYQGLLQATDH